MDERLPRKLAAIVYADVAGYSRLTGEDEDATHRTLREYLDLIAVRVGSHRGQVVHYAGDAVLARFDAIVDALSCAVAVQGELRERNGRLAEERRVHFRIGVNLGDVIEDRGDIYGDGVNVAARLESLAAPGGICISESVRTAVGNKLPLDYEFLGEQSVKNITEPVKAYHARVRPGAELPAMPGPDPGRRPVAPRIALTLAAVVLVVIGGALAWLAPWRPEVEPAIAERMALPLPEEPSVAVLAFDNLGGSPDQEYLADGLAENIITALSRIEDLFVIARNSSFTYKGKPVDVRQVARELGVRYVLEGSVQRSGERLRITTQLIDGTDGRHVWAEQFDRGLEDVFAIQDAITREVVTAMGLSLTGGTDFQTYSEGTTSFQAFVHLLRGNAHFHRFRKSENVLARKELEQALMLDPGYGEAMVQLGWTHWADARYGWSDSREESIRIAEDYAERGERAGSIAFGLRSLLHLIRGEIDEAVAMRRRDVETRPSGADVHALMGLVLVYGGAPEESIPYLKRAMRLSPMYPTWYAGVLGEAYRLVGRHDEAIASLRSVLKREPEDVRIARVRLVASLVQAGRLAEARTVAEEVLRLSPDFSVARYARSRLYRDKAVTETLAAALRQAGLPE